MLKNRNIPFGYCMINGKYALNVAEADAVRKIFTRYISGDSLTKIAAEMDVPYNTDKAVWNKNMVSRVLENKKYLGESGYPKIITKWEFEQAAQKKAERTTYRKPARQTVPQENKNIEYIYEPTDEIQRTTNEISQMLSAENVDTEKTEALIAECVQLKYTSIKEATI